MRTAELQAQLDSIERQLQALSGLSPSEFWVLVPISTAPCPPEPLVRSWLKDTGVLDEADVPVLIQPSRHQATTPLVQTPGFAGELTAHGWHLVAIDSPLPVRGEHSDDILTAWYHSTLTDRFHAFLADRQRTVTNTASS